VRSNFSKYLEYLLLSKGRAQNALGAAQARGAHADIIKALEAHALGMTIKSAIATGTTSDSTWGGPLGAIRSMSTEWFETLRTVSALDALLPEMQRVPPNQSYGVTTATGTGHVVTEASWKPLTKMQFSAGTLGPQKAMALVVVTDGLFRFAADSGHALIESELRGAVAAATDGTVVTALLEGLTLIPSAGDARADIEAALGAVPLKQTSKPFILTGMPLLGLDALTTHGSDGSLLLVVDANQIGGDAGALDLTVSNQATLQMDDAPTQGASNLVSLFQTDSLALMAERWFWLKKIRTNAVAAVKHASYTLGSP
jgi:hypothetical protein